MYSHWETCLDYAKRNVKDEAAMAKRKLVNMVIFVSLELCMYWSSLLLTHHFQSTLLSGLAHVASNASNNNVMVLQAAASNPQTNPTAHALLLASAIRINTFIHLSLTLSVSVAMVSIVCYQWFSKYEEDPKDIPLPRRDILGVYYMRKHGLERWHVFKIVETLPFISYSSIILYFASIIEELRVSDRTTLIPVSVVIWIITTFMVITTILPTSNPGFELIDEVLMALGA
jgi:hypothetical protein